METADAAGEDWAGDDDGHDGVEGEGDGTDDAGNLPGR